MREQIRPIPERHMQGYTELKQIPSEDLPEYALGQIVEAEVADLRKPTGVASGSH